MKEVFDVRHYLVYVTIATNVITKEMRKKVLILFVFCISKYNHDHGMFKIARFSYINS